VNDASYKFETKSKQFKRYFSIKTQHNVAVFTVAMSPCWGGKSSQYTD